MQKPTCTEIAENYKLWEEHADQEGTMTEKQFDKLSTAKKVKMLHEMFPSDCNCPLTFKQAIAILAKTTKNENALQAIYNEIEPLCKTQTDGNGGNETTLYDWLANGEYHTSDTAKSIATEWDELSNQ